MGGEAGGQSENIPLQCILKTFKMRFNGNYGVKMILDKLRTFCEINLPTFSIGWPMERLLGKVIVNNIFEVIVGEPGHPDQFFFN
jgi:hypothetical protein